MRKDAVRVSRGNQQRANLENVAKSSQDSILFNSQINNTIRGQGRELEREELFKRGWCKKHHYSGETCLSCKTENQKVGRKQLAEEILRDFWYKDDVQHGELKEKLQKEVKQ